MSFMNGSSEILHARPPEKNVAHWLPLAKRDDPSERTEILAKYFP